MGQSQWLGLSPFWSGRQHWLIRSVPEGERECHLLTGVCLRYFHKRGDRMTWQSKTGGCGDSRLRDLPTAANRGQFAVGPHNRVVGDEKRYLCGVRDNAHRARVAALTWKSSRPRSTGR